MPWLTTTKFRNYNEFFKTLLKKNYSFFPMFQKLKRNFRHLHERNKYSDKQCAYLYCVNIPLFELCGRGMHNVIGLWNFRLLGSTVTIGETATLFPCKRVTISCGTTCACTETLIVFVKDPSGNIACNIENETASRFNNKKNL